ncbi:MAG: DeoR/GlpR transcriptional regulator [Ferruginibacter sp.]|nr:DeoR/GlpR transcriptional regulator [Ferruginibacter sp.]
MLKTDSHAFILHERNLHNKVWLAEVSMPTGMPCTLERTLQKEGELINVPGGAISSSFYPRHHTPNVVYVYTRKNIIAQKAIALIKEDMFALSRGSAGITKTAGALRPDFHTNFIADSTPALFEYSSQANIEVIVTGDKISKNSQNTIGPGAVTKVKKSAASLYCPAIEAVKL